MNLHEDKKLFEQTIDIVSEKLKINAAIIEKDYYVTYILKKLVTSDSSIVFKGGTSLSKCYKVIQRFSEDIDLNYSDGSFKLTESMRRNFNQTVIDVANTSPLQLSNREEIRRRRGFNKYIINYGSEYSMTTLKANLIVETAITIPSFPIKEMNADCYIYEFLNQGNFEDIIKRYDLTPYKVKVQILERTFVDKIFAVCDYYLGKNEKKHSRHLYDLYKLYPKIKIDDEFKNLIEKVKEIRSLNKMCISAQSNCNIYDIVQEIIEKDFYKRDYEEITKDLLFEDVKYVNVIENLRQINELKIF